MKKILFVAMQTSIHNAMWINQISKTNYEVHLFPINDVPIHPFLDKKVIVHYNYSFYKIIKRFLLRFLRKKQQGKGSRKIKFINKIPIVASKLQALNHKLYMFGNAEASVPLSYGPQVLAKLIKQLKPDLIHSLEFQNCGYNVLKAKLLFKKDNLKFPKWWATNWGSDICYYQSFENHKEQIIKLLSEADYYSCECNRDIKIVKDLGFRGKIMEVIPNTGGIDINLASRLRSIQLPSNRKIIMVKGYQNFAGRELTALEAIKKCVPLLKGYEVIVYSVHDYDIPKIVQEMNYHLGFSVKILPYIQNHQQILELLSKARIHIGAPVTGEISTSLLEAMAMGAFPIQTNTSCCEEWIKDGLSGFVIPPHDDDFIALRIGHAITDDNLVDNAYKLNWETVIKILDSKKLKIKATELYDILFNYNPVTTNE